MASNPPAPVPDGIFFTVVKCAWCHRRCDFYYEQPGGGNGHRFRDWISGRVDNRWDIVCDPCNARGRPPHYGRFKNTGFPPVIWDVIMLYTYKACALEDAGRTLHGMNPDYGPCSFTFRRSPINYIHDTRMWVGVACPHVGCHYISRTTGICSHTEELRRRLFRRQIQLDMSHSARTGRVTPALRQLGLTQADAQEAIQLQEVMNGIIQDALLIRQLNLRTGDAEPNAYYEAVTNDDDEAATADPLVRRVVNDTIIDSIPAAMTEHVDHAITEQERVTSETEGQTASDEESDYEGPRLSSMIFCENCDTRIGAEGSVLMECLRCHLETKCTHCCRPDFLWCCRCRKRDVAWQSLRETRRGHEGMGGSRYDGSSSSSRP